MQWYNVARNTRHTHNDYYEFLYMIYIDTTIIFEQEEYRVNENDGMAQFVLVLSNPVSTNVSVQVITTDLSTGKNTQHKLHTLF